MNRAEMLLAVWEQDPPAALTDLRDAAILLGSRQMASVDTTEGPISETRQFCDGSILRIDYAGGVARAFPKEVEP